MAMSMEELNRKLEKVLQQLDKAIEDKDVMKANKVINDVKKLNEKSEGEKYDTILSKLEEAINGITKEMRDNEDLEADEIKDLSNIRNSIVSGKEPFVNIQKVVESLEEKGVNQEELKQHKKAQKEDNSIQIEGIRKSNQELSTKIVDIEMRYMEPIEKTNEAIKILNELKSLSKKLVALDPSMDREAINAISSDFKAKVSAYNHTLIPTKEAQGERINESMYENLESDPIKTLKGFSSECDRMSGVLQTISNNIAKGITTDKSINYAFKAQYNLSNVKDASNLEARFKEMIVTRQKNSSKITTLEAENKQIDKTIKTLKREEKTQNMIYNADGSIKSEEEIAQMMLDKKSRGRQSRRYFDEDGNIKSDEELAKEVFKNRKYAKEIEEDVNNKFKGGFIDRFRARREFYKQTQGDVKFSGIKAFFKAAFSKTNKVKMIVAATEATNKGKQIIQNAALEGIEMSYGADDKMRARQNTFKETMRREAVKTMSKNSSLSEEEIKNDAMRKAYDRAAGEDNSR